MAGTRDSDNNIGLIGEIIFFFIIVYISIHSDI